MKKWIKKKCYPDRPEWASLDGWDDIDKKDKEKPLCYFCVHILPSWWTETKRKINLPWMWVQYRLNPNHKYHLINTGLEPNYYDIDTRMLHGMFNMLKEFVEYESSWNHWIWQDEEDRPESFNEGREAGLESLAWQKMLTYGEDECKAAGKEELIGKLTHQAEAAIEIEALYLWWVDDRPARVDPWDDDVADKDRWALEQQHKNEDTRMLTRLIKIRGSLWT